MSYFDYTHERTLILFDLRARGRHLPITHPEKTTPIIEERLFANGPNSPDVDALFRNTNSMYFGRNWANPTTASILKMLDSNENRNTLFRNNLLPISISSRHHSTIFVGPVSSSMFLLTSSAFV